ncbi:D-2-hydroxyacid dehydrogenase [Desulfovibrio sp. OttesenSCG-928-C14]|nr:D-2-hydroxyacid dehydrogenase [Desulfovibrio sp. OttesenSCG-928-C14]
MKIVILEGIAANPGDCNWDAFKGLGELTVYDRTPRDKIVERIGDAEIVLCCLESGLTREVLDACPNIKYIGLMSAGYNYCDVAAAKEKGIPACNIPTYGPYTVAQFTISLLLEICSNVGHYNQKVYDGTWAKTGYWFYMDKPLIELAGKTMGVIGLGRIGKYTARMAKAFGMNILAYDEYPDDEGRSIAEYVDLDTLYAKSDVIALHTPLFESNRNMINKNSIAKMKDGVIILNTARGPLVSEQDLADALNSGKVAAAGLDTTASEPVEADNPLMKAKNCFITPHIAWAPQESRQRLINLAADNIRAFLDGKPINVVNK